MWPLEAKTGRLLFPSQYRPNTNKDWIQRISSKVNDQYMRIFLIVY